MKVEYENQEVSFPSNSLWDVYERKTKQTEQNKDKWSLMCTMEQVGDFLPSDMATQRTQACGLHSISFFC